MNESKVVFEIDQKILDNIRATFKDKSKVEIGILNSAGGKNGPAAIGGYQEFGAKVPVTERMRGWFFNVHHIQLKATTKYIFIPARSFLRKTASYRADAFMAQLNGASDSILFDIVEGNWRNSLKRMGEIWVQFIKECFTSRGWGSWRPLSSFTKMDKGHDEPLYKSGQLERSIESQVVSSD
jgi:hypothetical protein